MLKRMISTLVIGACLAGCAGTEARHDAVRASGPDAHGFLILGAADENARTELFFVTKSFGVNLIRADGQQASAVREGCNTYKGLLSGQSCASDKTIAWQLIELPPGEWAFASIHEGILRGFPARLDDVNAKLPPGIKVHIGPGEIVYAGDFLFNVNPDTLESYLKTYSRDDAAAGRLLATYPNLTGGFVYREPTHPVTGGT